MAGSPSVVQALTGSPRREKCVGQRVRMLADAGNVGWGPDSRRQLVESELDSAEVLSVLRSGDVAVTKSDPTNQKFGCSVCAELRDGRVIALGVNVTSERVVVETISLETKQ